MEKAKVSRAIVEIIGIEREIRICEPLPESLDEIGLGDLVDPWGNPYQYLKVEGGERQRESEKRPFYGPGKFRF